MPGGRPTKMTKDTLKKLEDAYLSDATHLQAAIFAGISEPTLHDYRNKHPEFSKRIESLRGMTGLQAKTNVRKAIELEESPDKGVGKSQWWLERRDPDFKPSSKQDLNINAQEDFLKALKGGKG